VTPNSRKQINEKLFFVVFFIMDSIVIYLYFDRRITRPIACSFAQWRRDMLNSSENPWVRIASSVQSRLETYLSESVPPKPEAKHAQVWFL